MGCLWVSVYAGSLPGISNSLPKFNLSFKIQPIFHIPKLYIINPIPLTSIKIKLITFFTFSNKLSFWLFHFCQQQSLLPVTQVQNPGLIFACSLTLYHHLSDPAAKPQKLVPSPLFPLHWPLSSFSLFLTSLLLKQYLYLALFPFQCIPS